MNQNTRLKDFMVRPFSLIFCDNRRIKVVIVFRTDVGNPVFHRFCWIITSRNKCHYYSPFLSKMVFSVFVNITFPAAGDLILFPEDIGVGSWVGYMLRLCLNTGDFEEFL